MHADDLVRSLRMRSNLRDRKRRGIGCQNAFRLAKLIQLLEQLRLDFHVFDGSLDDDVALSCHLIDIQRRDDVLQGLVLLLFRDFPLGNAPVQILGDLGNTAVDKFLLDIIQIGLFTDGCKNLSDAAAHLSCTDDHNRINCHNSILLMVKISLLLQSSKHLPAPYRSKVLLRRSSVLFS